MPTIVASGNCVWRSSVELPGPHPMSADVGHHLVGDLGDQVFDWAAPFRFELAVLGGRPTHRSAPSQVNAGIPHLDSTASWRSQFSLLHIIFGPDNAYLRDQTQRQAFPKVRRVWE